MVSEGTDNIDMNDDSGCGPPKLPVPRRVLVLPAVVVAAVSDVGLQ